MYTLLTAHGVLVCTTCASYHLCLSVLCIVHTHAELCIQHTQHVVHDALHHTYLSKASARPIQIAGQHSYWGSLLLYMPSAKASSSLSDVQSIIERCVAISSCCNQCSKVFVMQNALQYATVCPGKALVQYMLIMVKEHCCCACKANAHCLQNYIH
jgi:hypothetical protein